MNERYSGITSVRRGPSIMTADEYARWLKDDPTVVWRCDSCGGICDIDAIYCDDPETGELVGPVLSSKVYCTTCGELACPRCGSTSCLGTCPERYA
jgi:hypothetical protein